MGERRVLLVGSMPFEDERTAMTTALDLVGDRLLAALPDGEVGEKSDAYPVGDRAAWVQTVIDRCEKDGGAWEVVSRGERGESGFPTGYETGPRLKPKYSPGEMHEHLNFGWADFFRESYPVFKELRAVRDLPDLKFQVGLPTGIGMTFGMMSPVNALRYARAFNKRMAIEANEILDEADPGDVLFQLEVPGDLALAYKLPRFLHGVAVRGVLSLLRQVRPEAPFGVHLCFGDLNHEALIHEGSIAPAVSFANALLARWPETHELAYVHFPLAEAATPPSLDPIYYEPLAHLDLPDGVRFVAGFVHEALDDDAHRRLLSIVEQVRGGPVDVASSCGLARRPEEQAEHLIRTAASLAEA